MTGFEPGPSVYNPSAKTTALRQIMLVKHKWLLFSIE